MSILAVVIIVFVSVGVGIFLGFVLAALGAVSASADRHIGEGRDGRE